MPETIGAYEPGWGEALRNIQQGCERDCSFCYGAEGADRRKQRKREDWDFPVINWNKVHRKYRKVHKQIMFPTTHDITENNFEACLIFLQRNLEVGNHVLIVSKMSYKIFNKLTKELWKYRRQLEVRITITARDQLLKSIFEKNSPWTEDQLLILESVLKLNLTISVSIEPFLEEDPIRLIQELMVRGITSIWIGPMNHRGRLRKISQTIADNFDYLEQIYSPQNLQTIYSNCFKLMKENPGVHIHFKDAFLKKMHIESPLNKKQFTLDRFFLPRPLSVAPPRKPLTTKIDKRTRKYRLRKAKTQAEQIFAQLEQIKVEIQEIDIDQAISGATQYYFIKYQYSDQQFEYLTRTALVNYIRHTYTNYEDYLSILDDLVLIPFTYRQMLGLYTRREEVHNKIKETFNAAIEAKYADAITQRFEDYEQSILDRKSGMTEVT